jgi:antirestriction protein ArdC
MWPDVPAATLMAQLRLRRLRWGDEGYAKEELVAELGSAFLCADLGITLEVRDDHAAYVASGSPR